MVEILLIEDDDFFRERLRDRLQEKGFDVTEAAGGKDGLERFAQSRPDLVLTDIVMADGEGIEAVITFHRIAPDVPIITMSGNPQYLDHSRKLGATDALLKPFTIDELISCIENSSRS